MHFQTSNFADDLDQGFWKKDPVNKMLRDMGEEQKHFLKDQFRHDMSRMAQKYNQVVGSNFHDDYLLPTKQKPRENMFLVNIDMSGYEPHEVCVKIINDVITIEGKHEDIKHGKAFISRQFSRKYTIPANVNQNKIQSTLTPDDKLTISAPYEYAQPSISNGKHQIHSPLNINQVWDTNNVFEDMVTKVNESHKKMMDNAFSNFDSFKPVLPRLSDASNTNGVFPSTPPKVTNIPPVIDKPRILDQEISDEGKEYHIKIDVHNFDPTELSVRTVNKCLVIEGRHDGTTEQQLVKKFQLPVDVEPEKITSRLTRDGILTVRIPKKDPAVEAARQVVSSAIAKKSANDKTYPQCLSHIIVPM